MVWASGSLFAFAFAATSAAGVAAPREDVEGLVRQAEDLAHFEAFAPAAAKLEIALRAAERQGSPALTALCLDRMGMVLDLEGRSAGGTEHHARALALAREIGDARLEASILASIGSGQFRLADYAAALGALGEALALQEQIGDDPGRARTLDFIGRVHYKRAAYGRARESYVLALAILDTTADRRWRSIVLEDLGDLDQEQGFYADALANYEAALRAREEIDDRPGQIYVLHLIGRCHMLQGANREALAWFGRALDRAREIGDEPGRALALYHTGIALSRQGAAEEALARYAEALAIKVRLSDRRQQAWILARMGDANASLEKWDAAVALYGRATALWQEIRDPRGEASGLDKAGLAYFRMGRYEQALRALNRSAEILESGQPAFLAPTLALIGRVHAARRDEAQALGFGERAIVLARGNENDEVLWAVAHRWAGIQRVLGRREEALAALTESLSAIERLRARLVAADEARAGFLEGKQEVYADAIDLLMELGRVEEALELAERARARAFLDLLGGRVPAGAAGAPPLTLAEMGEEAARRDATIVEYFSASRRLFAWTLGPDGRAHGAVTSVSRRELSRLARRARGKNPGAREALRALHRVLIDPIASRLPRDPASLVAIIPHGPLFLVSFAALIGDDGRYFLDGHTLAYSPAIGVMRYTETQRRRAVGGSSETVLVVGNPTMPPASGGGRTLEPLPAAEAEARTIGELYPPGRVTALTGPRAREQAVRELAPKETVIHLATHAVLFDDEPLSSFLALAPESGAGRRESAGDGRLTVREVFELELRANLVTLSACSTGLGLVNGDGVLGLSRAFLSAGAPSVLVSLWRVADSVTRFQMERFYRALIANRGDKAAALRTAELDTIRQLRRSRLLAPSGRPLPEEPLLWAPFVLVGEAR